MQVIPGTIYGTAKLAIPSACKNNWSPSVHNREWNFSIWRIHSSQEMSHTFLQGPLLLTYISWTHIETRAWVINNIIMKEDAPWWSHQMDTFSAVLGLCAENSPMTCEFSEQRPVTWGFDVFFDLHLNKWLSKQSWGWIFETRRHRAHYDVIAITFTHPWLHFQLQIN